MIKYAKCYLDKLVFETDAIDAVFTLCSIWQLRPSFCQEHELFGLSEPEFNAAAYILYAGEVGNGGHCQFFVNPTGDHSNAVSRALAELQFETARDIFRRACSAFPSGVVPPGFHERSAAINLLPPRVFEYWGTLDREVYAVNMDYWESLISYLRQHNTQILRPEREGSVR